MKYQVKGINLLPKEYIRAEQVIFYQKIIGAVLAVETVLFVFCIALPPKHEIKVKQMALDDAYVKLNDSKFDNVNQTIQKLEDTKSDMKKWEVTYKGLKQDIFVSSSELDGITSRLPIGVTIDKLTMTPGEKGDNQENANATISIAGTSETYGAVMNYVGVIESIYNTKNVTHSVTGNSTNLGTSYQYTMDIEVPVEAPKQAADSDVNGQVADASQSGEGGN